MKTTVNENNAPIVLFDGVCNLCNASVQFILKNEKEEKLKFATIQDARSQELLTPFNNTEIHDSVLLLENGILYQESDAALRIARYLKFYRFFYFLIYIPRWIRNPLYRLIAGNRYKWFGKRDQCMIPDKKVAHRFL
ncbi:MAG: DCC1-like thiol-disulfide oxidoreductase family protein [Prolixibacteraceae bacterium]|jgi:predicted DCC family thiol-disulfide oxidoreductase YuxK|nr:DCC1-like thiol-disulfide oxidoreductase family protein [Prolixibacteraceae bacterium]